jgi:hypothetical protein
MVNELEPAVGFHTRFHWLSDKTAGPAQFCNADAGQPGACAEHAIWTRGICEANARWAQSRTGRLESSNVEDLQAKVAELRKAQLRFRNDIVQGPGGSEIILEDPSGNPDELLEPAR